MNELPFRTLLYRYFFFGWLFKNSKAEDAFERGLAQHHNKRQARWLPTYMRRWLWWGVFFYALGGLGEMMWESESLARWLYAFSAMCLSYTVTIATAWLHLTHKHEPT